MDRISQASGLVFAAVGEYATHNPSTVATTATAAIALLATSFILNDNPSGFTRKAVILSTTSAVALMVAGLFNAATIPLYALVGLTIWHVRSSYQAQKAAVDAQAATVLAKQHRRDGKAEQQRQTTAAASVLEGQVNTQAEEIRTLTEQNHTLTEQLEAFKQANQSCRSITSVPSVAIPDVVRAATGYSGFYQSSTGLFGSRDDD